jgi:hypothetical protein
VPRPGFPRTLLELQARFPDEQACRFDRVFGNLQTWLRGTHHGVSAKHPQAYLDEFTFRFNRRHTPMAAFQTLPGLGGQQGATTYKGVELTG